MLDKIIQYSLDNKLIVIIFSIAIIGFGSYSMLNIPIGAVPDITNNQVQIITTSRNLATEDVEKFITYPIELEMANLPEVKEIRSISKFGLSVVTVVFNDKINTYLPRQLIAEKIKAAESKIPSGFGKPFMGPISTGLGEIYQYVIEVDDEYKDKYSLMDIRTIQDWVVKRQLSGISGVVEVNTWGGHLKQYEIAINPEKLRSLNLSISQTFSVLEKNNSIAGGGYIEKTNQTFFIRGEGLITSIEDIENIVIEIREGFPIFIKDVAKVGYGKATRFGAITGNGEGEKVLGQVMMLKGANSKAVIDAVKLRIEQIAPSLPKGIRINPFLERSELIAKTTRTISENLILGFLIVIFIVVLLLGNLRSGLVVASVIPLCLLFALTLMYVFGVDANLMSLGAIDFGIIIDGAVIIVEYIAFKITAEHHQLINKPAEEQQKLIDKITFRSASKMMHSAIFGQIIIIIVFIPILSLVGVEGKMFRPMALVFCFALLGAMLLCFTYVPVMAALLIKPNPSEKNNFSSRFINVLQKYYEAILSWALNQQKMILSFAFLLLLGAIILFSRMGGEFVPTLDEGDFVIQPVLKIGTTLTKTTEITTQIETILKKFPEVKQVVSRIGAAEVPTDPMSMEESDVIIKLKPRKEWTSTKSKDELADKFKAALAIIPGVEIEFTQPIEMRFNELITGVRADLAIKVFGEDLDLLYQKALEIEKVIQDIEGAADISVEKIVGLPQMMVQYNRQKIAKYGLNIEELNNIIAIGFAGKTAGMVFEGEKQFDLVVRFDQAHQQDIQDLKNATIQLPNHAQLPLSEFATITYAKGPAKISRDNTKRRIVVGVNVRNRDLESVVEDVRSKIESAISLPTGYTIEYGGQFENLRTAKARLVIAVPIALLLIFIILYFAFGSIKEALLIYSAIPMSTVGGVLFLYIRGLPFSVSAGVGFIALFGIAVLNGIVLIEEFKELKDSGVSDIYERIIKGTKNRLRPVLLTAMAAALGFLPMAVSTYAGAEIQRPLATVVIGGLISATLLTLILLPILYTLFERTQLRFNFKIPIKTPTLLLFFILPSIGLSQVKEVDISQAISLAAENNLGLKASAQRTELGKSLLGSAYGLNKLEIFYNSDQNNIASNGYPLEVWGINQSIEFPSIYGANKKVMKGKEQLLKDQYTIDKQRLIKEVSVAFYESLYWNKMLENFIPIDSLYASFVQLASIQFELGESNYLDQLTVKAKKKDAEIRLTVLKENIKKSNAMLNYWVQADQEVVAQSTSFDKIVILPLDTLNNPSLTYYSNAIKLAQKETALQKQKLLPDLNFSIFQGNNDQINNKSYNGVRVGLAFPLWFGNQKSKIEASKIEKQILESESNNLKNSLVTKYVRLLSDIETYEEQLNYYKSVGEKLASETIYHAEKSFENGEINILQYIQFLENAKKITSDYLTALFLYNKTILEANYLMQ